MVWTGQFGSSPKSSSSSSIASLHPTEKWKQGSENREEVGFSRDVPDRKIGSMVIGSMGCFIYFKTWDNTPPKKLTAGNWKWWFPIGISFSKGPPFSGEPCFFLGEVYWGEITHWSDSPPGLDERYGKSERPNILNPDVRSGLNSTPMTFPYNRGWEKSTQVRRGLYTHYKDSVIKGGMSLSPI